MSAGGHTDDDCDYTRFFGKGCIQKTSFIALPLKV